MGSTGSPWLPWKRGEARRQATVAAEIRRKWVFTNNTEVIAADYRRIWTFQEGESKREQQEQLFIEALEAGLKSGRCNFTAFYVNSFE